MTPKAQCRDSKSSPKTSLTTYLHFGQEYGLLHQDARQPEPQNSSWQLLENSASDQASFSDSPPSEEDALLEDSEPLPSSASPSATLDAAYGAFFFFFSVSGFGADPV